MGVDQLQGLVGSVPLEAVWGAAGAALTQVTNFAVSRKNAHIREIQSTYEAVNEQHRQLIEGYRDQQHELREQVQKLSAQVGDLFAELSRSREALAKAQGQVTALQAEVQILRERRRD